MTKILLPNQLEVANYCDSLPWGVGRSLRRSLRWIDPTHLEGLSIISLVDGLPPITPESEEWHQRAKKYGFGVCGWYSRKTGDTPANITLNIRDIFDLFPAPYLFTPVPTLLITRIVAHEVAHHLVARRGYIFKLGENLRRMEYEEDAADAYALATLQRMRQCRIYRLGQWLIKDLADWNYIFGVLDWRDKKYKKAARRWENAYFLNPDLQEASYWYWQAVKMQGL